MMPTRRACLAGAAAMFVTPPPPGFRVVGLNVRVPVDVAPERRWAARFPVAAAMLRRVAPDVIGTQETRREQADDVCAAMPNYAWIGRDRHGGHADEHMAILYRKDRWRVAQQGDFWFSDTPAMPGSRQWGNPYPRMVTWALLHPRAGGIPRYVVNTHFPYRSEDEDVRTRCARMLARWIAALPPAVPVVLTGDFNADPSSPSHAILATVLRDARAAAPAVTGPPGTFHDFTGRATRRIDWIFSRGLIVRRFATLTDHDGAIWPSDHHATLADFA